MTRSCPALILDAASKRTTKMGGKVAAGSYSSRRPIERHGVKLANFGGVMPHRPGSGGCSKASPKPRAILSKRNETRAQLQVGFDDRFQPWASK